MEQNTTFKERLLEYLRKKRISQTEFTKALGVSPTYIGAMRKGMPAQKLMKIYELYPDLNRDWLLYGEGEMLKDVTSAPSGKNMPEGNEVLLLPVEAFAGGLQMYSEGVCREDCRWIFTPVKGAEYAIPINGDSMEPKFHNGSILLIKKINEKAFIPWGHPMVIDTENGVLIKKLKPAEARDGSEQQVIAESFNPDYPPFRIPVSSIYGWYRVVGTMEMFPTL